MFASVEKAPWRNVDVLVVGDSGRLRLRLLCAFGAILTDTSPFPPCRTPLHLSIVARNEYVFNQLLQCKQYVGRHGEMKKQL